MHPYDDTTGPWLASWFQHPARTDLPTGHHLRPLREADDGLPGLPADLDLAVVVAAAAGRTAYAYGVFDDEERSVLGVVRLAPGRGQESSYDVVVGWSVTDPDCASLVAALEEHLPGWLDRRWPFTSRRVVRT